MSSKSNTYGIAMGPELLEIQRLRQSKVIVYALSDRPNLQLQMEDDQIEAIHRLLVDLGDQEKIDLFIYSRGGSTVVPLPLVRLIRKYCKKFSVLVPFRAHSAATMVCVGADEVYMSRKAELGPVDQQLTVNTQSGQRVYASTDLFAYLEFAKNEIGWKTSNSDSSLELMEFFHKYSLLPPDIIGKIYRMFTQSKKYIEELADSHGDGHAIDKKRRHSLAEVLVNGFGSHDYKIDSNEAMKKLGLKVVPYNLELEKAIEALFNKVGDVLELNNPFMPNPGTNGQVTMGILKSDNKELKKLADYDVTQPQMTAMGPMPPMVNLKPLAWK